MTEIAEALFIFSDCPSMPTFSYITLSFPRYVEIQCSCHIKNDNTAATFNEALKIATKALA